MRKTLQLIVVFVLTLSLSFQQGGNATAQSDAANIKDMMGKNVMLMDDGSIWVVDTIWGSHTMHVPGQIVAISGRGYSWYGITANGELVHFGINEPPAIVAGQTGVKQVAGYRWLKTDGTVWTSAGKMKDLDGVQHIAMGENSRVFGVLTQSGDVLLEDEYNPGRFRKLGSIADAPSVVALTVNDYRIALLYSSGKVVEYDRFAYDDNMRIMRIIPVTIAEDAIHIAYVSDESSPILIVTRKDGTVWWSGDDRDRSKLSQLPGLSQVVKTSRVADEEHFYAQRADGSWVYYHEEEVSPFNAPVVNKVDATLSNLEPLVNQTINVGIQETYTNGAEFKVPATEANVTVQKPFVLKLQPNGKLKAVGVGQTEVTVVSSGMATTFTVSVSMQNKLNHAKLVNGVVFVPVQSVFKALGGTVASNGGAADVKLGDTTISLKTGEKNAKVGDKTIRMKAAPVIDNGELLFAASLLTDSLGARVQWDATWMQAMISFGNASMTVVSNDTAKLIKKAAQGSLAKYIGKTYWVNHFQAWERFSKVTITDILPDDIGYFTIVFKTGAGKTLESYSMGASNVTDLFSNEYEFLSYDPYKKYAWSASVWKQVKAEQVSLGMNKDQVRLAWGYPTSKSVASFSGKTIEVWGYGNYSMVSFVNGKVTMVIE